MTLIVTGPTHTLADEIVTTTVTVDDKEHEFYTHDSKKIHSITNKHDIPMYYTVIGTVVDYNTLLTLASKLTLDQLVDPSIGKVLSRTLDYDYRRSNTSNSGTNTTVQIILPKHNQLIRLTRTPKGGLTATLKTLDKLDDYAHEGIDSSILYLHYLSLHTPGFDLDLTTDELFSLAMLSGYDELGDRYQRLDHATCTIETGLDTKQLIRETLPPLFKRHPVLKGIFGTQYKLLPTLKHKGDTQ